MAPHDPASFAVWWILCSFTYRATAASQQHYWSPAFHAAPLQHMYSMVCFNAPYLLMPDLRANAVCFAGALQVLHASMGG